MKRGQSSIGIIVVLILVALIYAQQKPGQVNTAQVNTGQTIQADGAYTSSADVAAYLAAYDKLPSNFITKANAEKLGWNSREGNLQEIAPGKSIGGDRFGNYEGQLPKKSGRQYYECDVNYSGGFRGGERIVFSNDGLIYYTNDHYKTFTELSGGGKQ